MGFKDLIWTSDKKETPVPASRASSTPPPIATSISSFPTNVPVDQAVLKKMQTAVLQQAPASIKSLEDNLATLADAIPDDSMRFKAALKLLEKSGTPIESLLGDCDKHLASLDAYKTSLDQIIQSKIDSNIKGKENQIEQLATSIQTKQEQINNLTREIGETNQKISTIRTEITTEQIQIDNVKAGSDSAYQFIKNDLSGRKVKILNFK